MISQDALQKILGIDESVSLSAKEMVKEMTITFFPEEGTHINKDVTSFSNALEDIFKKLNIKIVPYDQALETVKLRKRVNRIFRILLNNIRYIYSRIVKLEGEFYYINLKSLKRVIRNKRLRRNVSVVVLGELNEENLPMQFISSFKSNSIIHILPFPENIKKDSPFEDHFDTAMSLFAYHMANIIIAVDNEKWMIYNFNASHPIYYLNDGLLEHHILNALVPKIVAPISPHKFSDFKISKDRFSINDPVIKNLLVDLKEGALLFEKTKLFPSGKKIDSLPFRDNFHKYIGKLHLDNRSGMSFGFISKQLPVNTSNLITIAETKKTYPEVISEGKDYFIDDSGDLHIIIDIPKKGLFSLKIPEVWVLTLRSGSDKTHFNPEKDLLMLGLSSKGQMWMKFPTSVKIHEDYKPSFDTKVILAHAVGNAIIASILNYLDSENSFVKELKVSGISISHWHGYFREDLIPGNCLIYGFKNLHVACSSPQSAIYALGGKLEAFEKIVTSDKNYQGDIHVEPHHGINISFLSLTTLAQYLVKNPEASKLGNIYLKE